MKYIHPEKRFALCPSHSDFDEIMLVNYFNKFFGSSDNIKYERLSGGFRNINYKVMFGNDSFVFKIFSQASDSFDKEVGILNFLNDTDINSPEIIDSFSDDKYSVAVMKFIDGKLLQNLLLEDNNQPTKLYENIGIELGKIHSVKFDQLGLIGPNMKIGNEFTHFGDFAKSFTSEIFHNVPKEYMLKEKSRRVSKLLEEKWHHVDELKIVKQLCHCDYNPKNILVSNNELKNISVLDWEFGMSGNGVIDFGNFLRFPYDYSDDFQRSLINGYKSIIPDFDEEQLLAAVLIDISSMASFLSRKNLDPSTIETVNSVIDNVLEKFGY